MCTCACAYACNCVSRCLVGGSLSNNVDTSVEFYVVL